MEFHLIPPLKDTELRVIVAHSGREDGSKSEIVMCGDQTLSPYSEKEFIVLVAAGKTLSPPPFSTYKNYLLPHPFKSL